MCCNAATDMHLFATLLSVVCIFIHGRDGRPLTRYSETNAAVHWSRMVVRSTMAVDTQETRHALPVDVQSVNPQTNDLHVQNNNSVSSTQLSIGVAKRPAGENVIHHLVWKIFRQSNSNIKKTRQDPDTNAKNSSSDIPDSERKRRNLGFNMADLANEEWSLNYTTHGPELMNDSYPLHDFEVISEEEIIRAKHLYIKKVLMYIGITMASVFAFTIIAIFFITDPKSCVLAFATGSPCCLVLSPCIVKGLAQFLNPGQVVRDQMNTYLPGMLIDRHGNIELYEITPAEMEAVQVMINDVIDFVA